MVALPPEAAKNLRDKLRRPPVDAGGVETPRAEDAEASKGGAAPGAGVVDDCRTLAIDYDEHGERFKRWRSFSREAKFHKFEDWPFEDSNSQMLFLIKHWDRHGEDGQVWLDIWLIDRGVCAQERTGIEMKTLVTTLHLAGTYDQLNTPCLAAF